MSPVPLNKKLYDHVKRAVVVMYPVHSAYRSAMIVKRYKNLGGTYTGKKPTRTGLTRWFRENWKSDTGHYGYTSKSSVYRPTRRVTPQTPKTFSELTPRELTRAKVQKRILGRVTKF